MSDNSQMSSDVDCIILDDPESDEEQGEAETEISGIVNSSGHCDVDCCRADDTLSKLYQVR